VAEDNLYTVDVKMKRSLPRERIQAQEAPPLEYIVQDGISSVGHPYSKSYPGDGRQIDSNMVIYGFSSFTAVIGRRYYLTAHFTRDASSYRTLEPRLEINAMGAVHKQDIAGGAVYIIMAFALFLLGFICVCVSVIIGRKCSQVCFDDAPSTSRHA
jgi:hypothetical protein